MNGNPNVLVKHVVQVSGEPAVPLPPSGALAETVARKFASFVSWLVFMLDVANE